MANLTPNSFLEKMKKKSNSSPNLPQSFHDVKNSRPPCIFSRSASFPNRCSGAREHPSHADCSHGRRRRAGASARRFPRSLFPCQHPSRGRRWLGEGRLAAAGRCERQRRRSGSSASGGGEARCARGLPPAGRAAGLKVAAVGQGCSRGCRTRSQP